MKIYEMTATFGKLEHETLTLKPGLNILHAPNEWGKSTWCAFLMAMLYGLDTRAKSTKAALADKEHYAPWSGSPMAGRMDLEWNGRDITIERRTKGRVPLGEFRAYETATGLAVPELTAANCGQTLLGVEQSVFRRAGFIRLSDLPVTQDEALRRRLNALVTTGDESGDGERLAKELRDLKNRCRYNRTGLLPQAEAERDDLEETIQEREALEIQSKKLKTRLGEVKSWTRQLENHKTALAFADAEADAGRVAEARDAWEQAERQLGALETACARLPAQEETDRKIAELKEFGEQWNSAQMEAQMLPQPPEPPQIPEVFREKDGENVLKMAREDGQRYRELAKAKTGWMWFLLGGIALAGAAGLALGKEYLFAGLALAAGLVLLALGQGKRREKSRKLAQFEEKYGSRDPGDWEAMARRFSEEQSAYALARAEYLTSRGNLDSRMEALRKRRDALCGAQSVEKMLEFWQKAAQLWEDCHDARREVQKAERHFRTLQAMAKPAKQPEMPDDLTYSASETARLLSDAAAEQQRLLSRLGQYQGRMEALGDGAELEKRRVQLNVRIAKLEDIYVALNVAQETLTEARMELQRRFAPRIAKRAQELLEAMTGGRYDRLTLGEDFSLRAGAGEEDTLRDALWRSDGTVDQLYLALRLAVSEELTPEAPLVLDDALVRFDDRRMKAALDILAEEGRKRQVLLFSCQSREEQALRTGNERNTGADPERKEI